MSETSHSSSNSKKKESQQQEIKERERNTTTIHVKAVHSLPLPLAANCEFFMLVESENRKWKKFVAS